MTDRTWLPLSLREAVKDLPEDKRLIVAAWHARGSDAIGSYQQRVAELGERIVAMEARIAELTAALDAVRPFIDYFNGLGPPHTVTGDDWDELDRLHDEALVAAGTPAVARQE